MKTYMCLNVAEDSKMITSLPMYDSYYKGLLPEPYAHPLTSVHIPLPPDNLLQALCGDISSSPPQPEYQCFRKVQIRWSDGTTTIAWEQAELSKT